MASASLDILVGISRTVDVKVNGKTLRPGEGQRVKKPRWVAGQEGVNDHHETVLEKIWRNHSVSIGSFGIM